MSRLGIICGGGALPVALAAAYPDAMCIAIAGAPHDVPGEVQEHHIEKIGGLFDALHAGGVTRLVMAGGLGRPHLDPSQFDAGMMQIAPRLLPALQSGDDGLLRLVISIFEEQGFAVVGAHELLPGLTVEEGLIVGANPSEGALTDIRHAAEILKALSPLDVGQGSVVASGLCLGIETLQGTDALMRFVALTPKALRRSKGVFVKAPKQGQDLRVDMPAIGPNTVLLAAEAGVEGIVVDAGRVVILDRPKTLAAFEETGLFLLGQVI